jgi:hypothetical protein
VLNDIVEWTKQQTQQGKLRRTWRKADDMEDLRKWRQQLDDVYQAFMVNTFDSLL